MRDNARGKKHPWTLQQTKQVQAWLIKQERWRDLAIVMVGVDSLLRSIDLRRLKYDDLVDVHGNIRARIIHGQQKTKRTVENCLSAPTRQAAAHWIAISGKQSGDYLFTRLKNRSDVLPNTPITRAALANIIKQCVEAIGLDPVRYSTKTLRCTRVRPILDAAAGDYQIPRILLGHADIRSTVHYCSVDEERALEVSEAVLYFDPLPFETEPVVTQIAADKFDETAQRQA